MLTYTERKFIEKNCLDFSNGYAETTTKSGKTAIIRGNRNCGSHFSLWVSEDQKWSAQEQDWKPSLQSCRHFNNHYAGPGGKSGQEGGKRMKKLITMILIVAVVMATVSVVYADDVEYIDLDGVPYEEIIMPPWFTSPGLPYIIEPDMAVWMVFRNIFLRYGHIYGV